MYRGKHNHFWPLCELGNWYCNLIINKLMAKALNILSHVMAHGDISNSVHSPLPKI